MASEQFTPLVTRLSSGERLCVLIDASGRPPRLALRFALHQRSKGGSARLERMIRRLAELYNWCEGCGIHLEERMFDQWQVPPRLLITALNSFEAIDDGDSKSSAPSAAITNGRISSWLAFVRFVTIRDNWRSGQFEIESAEERSGRQAYLTELETVLEERRRSSGTGKSHLPLSKHELEAIDRVFQGHGGSLFSIQARMRNRTLYALVRGTGVRIGEALKIKIEDLPRRKSSRDRQLAQIVGMPDELAIRRRPDDADDPRTREARVKRGNRNIPIADRLCSQLQSYASSRGFGASDYLFVSTKDISKPLSQSRAEKIIKKIGLAAHELFALHYSNEKSSLDRLCWHRLRTTRACELAPEYFSADKISEDDKRLFVRYFGWADLASADPYIESARSARTDQLKQRLRDAY